MKDKTLHMIGNAHLDPVWLWQWQEGFQRAKATFRSALDRMNEYPDFLFTSSTAVTYEWIEHNEPEMFAEIKARIAEGRWRLCGGWWVQADCNLPNGESFVRQALYGQRYFKEKFGVVARVGYNVDSFGHHGMLPQLLKKSGMDFYVFSRPSPHEASLPGHLFWWESNDGSRVLTFRILYEYLSPRGDIEKNVRRCVPELREPIRELMCFYGVGNHGGGPTRENLDSIIRLDQDPGMPRLLFSTPEQFFDAVLAEDWPIPVVHDDLQHHAIGCYAAHSGIKRWNRRAENLLVTAEKFSTVASWATRQPYPADFDRAWKNVLFNQFHDILAGTSIEPAYDDARDTYGEALAIADRALNNAIQSLAWRIQIDLEEGMKPIVVFNPHSWQSNVNVELEVGGRFPTDLLLDDEGQPVPSQRVQSLAAARGRYRLSFVADLPPMGYRVYRLYQSEAPASQTSEVLGDFGSLAAAGSLIAPALEATDTSMENERFRLEINPETGCIASLLDKRLQFQVFRGEAARPFVIDDQSDTWGHGLHAFQQVCGTFTPKSIRLVEHGPVKAVIRVESEYGSSRLFQDFTLYRELDQIDVHVTVDWREKFQMLKLVFTANLDFITATYEVPFGHIHRATNGLERPGQSWIDCSGLASVLEVPYGLSILNDAKYSYDILNKAMSLTVLRSPIYAHHVPFVPPEDGLYAVIDQGIQRFTYTLLPHEGGWEQAGTVRRAAELNQRPITLIETYHDGPLPQRDSYLSVDRDNVVVSALKKAEDDDAMIVRCYETHEIATRATISLPKWNRTIEADLGPCEIKTFRVPRDETLPVVETNLLEWPEGETDSGGSPNGREGLASPDGRADPREVLAIGGGDG